MITITGNGDNPNNQKENHAPQSWFSGKWVYLQDDGVLSNCLRCPLNHDYGTMGEKGNHHLFFQVNSLKMADFFGGMC